MNLPRCFTRSGTLLMVLALALLIPWPRAVFAQMGLEMDGLDTNGMDLENLDIDEVMQTLDRDFTFGDREVVKQENLTVTVEAQQEDVQTRKEEVRTRVLESGQNSLQGVDVQNTDLALKLTPVEFILENKNSVSGDNLDFFVIGFPSLAAGFTGNILTSTLNLPSGSAQKLAVKCNGSETPQCIVKVGFQQGANFRSSPKGTQKVSIGATVFFTFDVF